MTYRARRAPARVRHDQHLDFRRRVLNELEFRHALGGSHHVDDGERVHDGAIGANDEIGGATGDFGDARATRGRTTGTVCARRTMSPVR